MCSNPVVVTKVCSGLFAIPSIAITTATIVTSFKFFPQKRVRGLFKWGFLGLKVCLTFFLAYLVGHVNAFLIEKSICGLNNLNIFSTKEWERSSRGVY